MNATEADRLCKGVTYASTQIRVSLGNRTSIAETLNWFWLLEDRLNRLIDVVDQNRGKVSQCRDVIRDVVSALESPQAKKRANNPRVQAARDKIDGLLMKLERANATTAS